MKKTIKTFGQFIKEELETTTKLNNILDKIASHGVGSITPQEKEYLNSFSRGEETKELDVMNTQNTSHPFDKKQSDNTLDYTIGEFTFIYETTEVTTNLINIIGSITYRGASYGGRIVFNRQTKGHSIYFPSLMEILDDVEEVEVYELIDDVIANIVEEED